MIEQDSVSKNKIEIKGQIYFLTVLEAAMSKIEGLASGKGLHAVLSHIGRAERGQGRQKGCQTCPFMRHPLL